MSDFGSMATVHRANGSNTSHDDEARIKREATALTSSSSHHISDYADFFIRIGSSSATDGSEGVMVGLTEYWLGDDEGNDGLDPEVLIARDQPLAERFGEELQATLGPEFRVEVYCGDW